MNYNEKLWKVKQFVEENFDDPTELVVALGMTVEDFINLVPDLLVANYHKFFETNDDDETDETEPFDPEFGEDWEQ
jgi:hypothetical protein